jgi:biopolymer transport protein ExbD
MTGWRVSLALMTLMAVTGAVFAQQGVRAPLQAGVSVQLPVTSNAVAIPDADNQTALVVAVTADGTTYLGVNPLPASALAESVKNLLSTRNDKTLYIKADARVPHARVIEVIDAVRNSGVDGLTFITAQQDAVGQGGKPVAPKGLEMRVVSARP